MGGAIHRVRPQAIAVLCCESSIEERSVGNPHATFALL
jgi:hypothetical protein